METKNVWISGIIATLLMTGTGTYFLLQGVDVDVSNCALINDSKVLIQVCPSTITQSQYIYAVISSKQFSGNIDFAIGVNGSNAHMTSFEIYRNVTDFNGTFERFVPYNLTEYNYDYDGKDTWNLGRNVPVVAGKDYLVRFYLDIVPGTSGKYDVALKPSSMTINQAINNNAFYILDPWWNSTTNTDYNMSVYPDYWSTLNNGSSTARIQPIYPYQDNIILSLGFEGVPTDELGRNTGSGTGIYTTGKIGQAVNTTSSTNLISTTTNGFPTGTANRTYNCWVYPTSNTGSQYLFNYGTNSAHAGFGVAKFSVANYSIWVHTGDYTTRATTILNQWQMITIVGIGTNISIYMNGTYMDSMVDASLNTGATTNIIGSSLASVSPFLGLVDECKLWNKALSSSEILAEYNNGSGRKYQQVNLQQQYPWYNFLPLYLQLENNTIDENYKFSGIPTGIIYGNGFIGYDAKFDGSTSKITITTPPVTTSDATYSFWIKPNITSASTAILDKWISTKYSYIFVIKNGNNLTVDISTNCLVGTVNEYTSKIRIANNTWQHIGIVTSGTNLSFYYNGVYNSSVTMAGTIPDCATPLIIGQNGDGTASDKVFNGEIDEVMIFNKTSSASDISYLYSLQNAGNRTNSSANMFYSLDNKGFYNTLINDTNNKTLSTTSSTSNCMGVRFNVTQIVNLTRVYIGSSSTFNSWAIYNGSYTPSSTVNTCAGGTGGTLLASGTFTNLYGNVTGGQVLNANSTYAFVVYPSSGSATMAYGGSSDLPVTGTSNIVKYFCGLSSNSACDNYIRNTQGIIFDVLSYPNISNYSAFIMNLTSNDNSTLARVSANGGLNWSVWFNASSNGQNISLPVPGNILLFQLNLTSDTSYVTSFGIINASGSQPVVGPVLTFLSQIPPDINSTNILNTRLNVTYNITNGTSNQVNYSTVMMFHKITGNRTFFVFTNGTAETEVWDSVGTVLSNDSTKWSSLLSELHIYPATYNWEESLMRTTQHNVQSLNNNGDCVKIQLLNVSNSTRYNWLEVMVNGTSNSADLFYCNSTYTTGSVVSNANCIGFGSINPNTPYDHTHSNYSSHKVFPLAIVNGSVGTVKVTNTSYFVIRVHNPSPVWNVYYIPNKTRTNASMLSTNDGNSWSDITGTIDSHLHQFDGTEYFNYYWTACDNNATCTNSSVRQDLLDLGGLPPSVPFIIIPTAGSFNNGTINITYLASVSPNAYAISYYNISLLNSDLTFNSTLRGNNGLNLSYLWNMSNFSNGYYGIKVEVKDINNLTSSDTSDLFIIRNFVITANTCPGVNANLTFNFSIRSYNITTGKLNELNVKPKNQTVCTFNITNTIALPVSMSVNVTSSQHQMRCNGFNLTTTPVQISTAINNMTVNCTMDYINATGQYKGKVTFDAI